MQGAEPGTGTQIAFFATPPDSDVAPNTCQINRRTWKCGHQYLDTELADVCTLVEVVGKSAWCDRRPAKNQPEKLVFEYERRGSLNNGRITVDPHSLDFDQDRFIERYTEPPEFAESPW